MRAVAAANPRTVVDRQRRARRCCCRGATRSRRSLLGYFGGQEFGIAIADVLFGAAEPGGRLPTTWPAALADVPVLDVTPTDGALDYAEGIHVGYRAWLQRPDRTPAFPFGYGLGYTTWSSSIGATAPTGATRERRRRGARDRDATPATAPASRSCRSTPSAPTPTSSARCAGWSASPSSVPMPARRVARRRAGAGASPRALGRRLERRARRVHAARGQLGRRPAARRDARRGGGLAR